MEINIFYTHEDWGKDNPVPNETLEGEVRIYRDTLIIETIEDGRRYKQIISPNKVFAITYKQPYGYFGYEKEIFLYLSSYSWSISEPEYSLKGEVCTDECINGYVAINTFDGYKQYISQDNIFSCVYEG